MRTVEVSWVANRETAVNSTGGGYKVYYSTKSGFNLTDTDVSEVDVPYASSPLTPTSVRIQLQSGQYYFRVLAYSALNAPWSNAGSMSLPSAEIVLLVP